VIWAISGGVWAAKVSSGPEPEPDVYDWYVVREVIASAVLDLFLVASELFHKVRLHMINRKKKKNVNEVQEMQEYKHA